MITWTYLTGVYNAATQTAQLYVNGSVSGVQAYDHALTAHQVSALCKNISQS
ncbi:hypothetical protein ABZ847_20690 [Streptomyces bauhiniae]